MHLRKTNSLFVIALLLLFTGCKEKKTNTEFVARVGSQYLTADALEKLTGKNPDPALREAAIRKWIDREALYLYAGSEKLDRDEEYNRLLEEVKRDLLAGLARKSAGSKAEEGITEVQVKEFYDSDSSRYKLPEAGFIFEFASFTTEASAIEFRSFALSSGWNQAVRIFKNKIENLQDAECKPGSAITEGNVVRLFTAMEDNETSIVINSANKFFVYHLVKKLKQNEIIPFDFAKSTAAGLLAATRRKEAEDKLLNELYSQYEIEIR